MTVQELGAKLANMYGTAGEKSTSMIHLFGVIYAEQIEAAGSNASEIVRAAGLPDSYKTEIRKGMNLAKYVQLKPEYGTRTRACLIIKELWWR